MSFNQSKDTKNNIKYIKIAADIDTYNIINQKAKDSKMSLQNYTVLKVTDDNKGCQEIRNLIAKMLPEYYNRIKGVGNTELKQYLDDFGGSLCQL